MKFSIITAVFNNKDLIETCIQSVLGQSYEDLEYIIVDGGSTDGTQEVIKRYENRISKIIAGKDKGLYDALNKGIEAASGDVIGFLHSDDWYVDSCVIEKAAERFSADPKLDSCYGNVIFVQKENASKVVRYWKAGGYDTRKFKWGWMPPHVAFFVRKRIYDRYGCFDTSYKICGDYEVILRFLYRHGVTSAYLPIDVVKMRMGGASTRNLFNVIRKNIEGCKACRMYGLSPFTVLMKNIIKIPQLFAYLNPCNRLATAVVIPAKAGIQTGFPGQEALIITHKPQRESDKKFPLPSREGIGEGV